ncbi:metallophosphoesterase [Roseicyclus persicicus]|uniref:Serine/threonine protein phosphatase n=1 Tax=Roseicyclus persicicus TaxID=2650661 RepID=A0A7X6H1M8_9RHOB|nr:metallophosphoesterase [Roseibacterium persicicum]NKX46368.1 serine/threonine protein phosphatase [Roseibacterium persicicum]
MTLYAIGDIHGHLDLLRAAHDRVAADRARMGTGAAPLVHVGDLVDRGPDSAGVVGWLAGRAAEDARVVVLKGNHDALFEAVLAGDPELPLDRYLGAGIGGAATLRSYGVDPGLPAPRLRAALRAAVPAAHRAFLSRLPLMHRAGGCAFVHAGIRPGLPLDAQAAEDLLWIRAPFLSDRRDHGALIVHGHTPVPEVELHPNRLAIDTGAAFGGPLSAVAIEGRAVALLTPTGRVPVRVLP